VYGDNGGRFPARGKGMRIPGPVEDGEKMLLRDVLEVANQFDRGSRQQMLKAEI